MDPQDTSPPVVPAKKGIPVLGWLGIGCGTIVIIGIVIIALLVGWCKRKVGDLSEFQRNPEKASAELMVKLNPDLKLVSQDESKGEMTIKTKDGQEVTMSYKDISQGKFTIKDADGNVTQIGGADLSTLPAWVPQVAGLKDVSCSSQKKPADQIAGFYMGTSSDTPDQLEEFFKKQAKKQGMTDASRSAFESDGVATRSLSYEGGGRKLSVMIAAKQGEPASVQVSFEGGK